MKTLLCSIKKTLNENRELPFSVYTSFKEQKLLNVPIPKPLLIVVLNGDKELGQDETSVCHAGSFVFLSDSPAINMRNIPQDKDYYALVIEFNYQDFSGLQINRSSKQDYLIGETTPTLEQCLQQFVEISIHTPKEVWSLRKREIIELLCHMGHSDILSLLGTPKVKDKVHDLFVTQHFQELSIKYICSQLITSESTLRRKLKQEGTNVQEIKDKARLSFGFHLLQTTRHSIGLIAEKCGYQSQSRFTDKFKSLYGLTPSELRKTKMAD